MTQPQTFTPVEMLAKLVGFPTVSRDSNLPLIHFVRDYLDSYGIKSVLTHNNDSTKANLHATIGPNEPGGVILSGHTDVVPIDNQPWDTDPFTLTPKNDKLYGRGSADMKGFSATALALVPHMLASNMKRPVHLALSYDEEVGCIGAPSMIRKMADTLPNVHAVVVGEPTLMNVVNAHKGIGAFTTTVLGRARHSSQIHLGGSAVMVAARLVTILEDMMDDESRNNRDDAFDPPHATIHVGMLNGGEALNVVAQRCQFVWDLRALPGQNIRSVFKKFQTLHQPILKKLKDVDPACDIQTELNVDTPPLKAEPNGTAEALCMSLAEQNHAAAVSYGTEAGQFQEAGFSTAVCGPGSIDQAHQANEFVAVEQIHSCEAFLKRLVQRLSSLPAPH